MEPNGPIVSQDNGKTAGIVSYFFIIGWLIAYFGMHQNNKTSLGSYQLRQTLLFHIIHMIIYFVFHRIVYGMYFAGGSFYFLLNGIIWIADLGLFVIWIIGLLGAIKGEKTAIPLIGDRAQTMFPNI